MDNELIPFCDALERYMDGCASEDEIQRLRSGIKADPGLRDFFVVTLYRDEVLCRTLNREEVQLGLELDNAYDDGEADEEALKLIRQEVMDSVVDQALAERRRHEAEHTASVQLAAQQAEQARQDRFRVQQPEPQPVQRVIVIPKALVWLGLAAAIGIVVAVGYHFNQESPQVKTPPIAEQDLGTDRTPRAAVEPAPVLATLIRELDARWDDTNTAWEGAYGLRQGQHMLAEGLVEIELSSGTRVVLEAPVSFELNGKNQMTLASGLLVANVPPSGYGFTVDTPTARIIDYGTEFGVQADGETQTQVHVFNGEVRAAALVDGLVVGEGVPVRGEQAAAIDAGGASVARVAFDAQAFERRVVKRLDLVDIVAGGDGTGAARMRGIDPRSGRIDVRGITDIDDVYLASDHSYHPVTASPFIDGICIPGAANGFQIDSSGRTVSGLRISQALTWQLLWAGGLMPGVPGDDVIRQSVSNRYHEAPDAAPVIYMISNKAITFDLEAIRDQHMPGAQVRMLAQVQNIANQLDSAGVMHADVQVYLDGVAIFEKRTLLAGDPLIDLDLSADPDAKFLTVVVTDGGDSLNSDWIVFHRPRLELTLPIGETGVLN